MTREQAVKIAFYLEDAIDLLAQTYKKDGRKQKKETEEAYYKLVQEDTKRCGFNRWKKL